MPLEKNLAEGKREHSVTSTQFFRKAKAAPKDKSLFTFLKKREIKTIPKTKIT